MTSPNEHKKINNIRITSKESCIFESIKSHLYEENSNG